MVMEERLLPVNMAVSEGVKYSLSSRNTLWFIIMLFAIFSIKTVPVIVRDSQQRRSLPQAKYQFLAEAKSYSRESRERW